MDQWFKEKSINNNYWFLQKPSLDESLTERNDHENDQLEPKETTKTKKEIKSVQFEQFSSLPDGLSKYIVGDLIGTPLDEIDNFYKDKQVINKSFFSSFFSSKKIVSSDLVQAQIVRNFIKLANGALTVK